MMIRTLSVVLLFTFSLHAFAENTTGHSADSLATNSMLANSGSYDSYLTSQLAQDTNLNPEVADSVYNVPGTWDANLYHGWLFDFGHGQQETVGFIEFAPEYYITQSLSFLPQFTGYYVNQRSKEDSAAVGFNLAFRSYIHQEELVKVYFEAAGGVFYAHTRVPHPRGTHFNFLAHFDFGAKWDIGQNAQFISAFRYLHLSNGNMQSDARNPSLDNIGFYFGLSYNF